METYIIMCKIDSQWEFVVCLRKLKQGLCINLDRWDGEGDGRGHMYTYGWFMLRFDRKQQNSVKQLFFHKNKFKKSKDNREEVLLSESSALKIWPKQIIEWFSWYVFLFKTVKQCYKFSVDLYICSKCSETFW